MFRFSRPVVGTVVGLWALVVGGVAVAADSDADVGTRKVNFVPTANAASQPPEGIKRRKPGADASPLVFSVPPKESAADASRIYQPVAAYFSRVLGRAVEYKRVDNWMMYQKEMARGDYDIILDGPHLNSWRITNLQHVPIAKFADQHSFSVIVRRADTHFAGLQQLAGKKICTMNSPDLDTLAMLAEFDPMRQPLVIAVDTPAQGYAALIQGKCEATTIPTAMLPKMETTGRVTRTVFESRALVGETFSAGPRVNSEEQIKLAHAIVSDDGKRALAALLNANGTDKGLALADKEEYRGMDVYLKDVWGLRR